jgi:hypothetical protein
VAFLSPPEHQTIDLKSGDESCVELEHRLSALRHTKPLLPAERLMSELGISGGLQLGHLLKELLTLQRNQEITTESEALTWLKSKTVV